VAPVKFTASLREPSIEATRPRHAPTGYRPTTTTAADGDVTGQLVYLNYGMPADYKETRALPASTSGARSSSPATGNGWRGLKPKLAQEHGAIGCIIYSDPRDDGYFKGDAYPKGGWRRPGRAARPPSWT